MRSFYFADGIIQGILALGCIAGVLSLIIHLPINDSAVIYLPMLLPFLMLCISVLTVKKLVNTAMLSAGFFLTISFTIY